MTCDQCHQVHKRLDGVLYQILTDIVEQSGVDHDTLKEPSYYHGLGKAYEIVKGYLNNGE